MQTQSTIKPKPINIKKFGYHHFEIEMSDNVKYFENEEGIMFSYDLIIYQQAIHTREELISSLIHMRYSTDDEIALIHKGISDNTQEEYMRYREFVAYCKNEADAFWREEGSK